jgi:RNA polymerase sigma-70 factor (ECF subfamily)
MDPSSGPEHLSQLPTLWTLVCQAHQGPEEEMQAARARLLERYGGVVRRYLAGALGDAEAADELSQEFALSFLRGDFRRADPERGRFRQYLKTALFHLVVQYRRRQQKQPLALGSKMPEPAAAPAGDTADQDFLRSWRDELLASTWDALREVEQTNDQPWYTVLRFRADHPDLPSPQMAQQLQAPLGKPLSPAGIRQLLRRAREKFADLLLERVADSLDRATAEELESELIELNLLAYCQPALKRRGSDRG